MNDGTRRCSTCAQHRPVASFGKWQTCSKCRRRNKWSGDPLATPPVGQQKCPACGHTKPIGCFEGRKSCDSCRAYQREWNRQRHTNDPSYRARINARVQERAATDERYRKRRAAANQVNARISGRLAAHRGEVLSTECVRCSTRFTYKLSGSRRRTLCNLCCKYRQEWSYYGLTGPEVFVIRAKQVCDICGTRNPGTKGGLFRIDHCHESGGVRGVLCHPCNIALGCMKDDPGRLRAAAEYLEKGRDAPG